MVQHVNPRIPSDASAPAAAFRRTVAVLACVALGGCFNVDLGIWSSLPWDDDDDAPPEYSQALLRCCRTRSSYDEAFERCLLQARECLGPCAEATPYCQASRDGGASVYDAAARVPTHVPGARHAQNGLERDP
jgi:hypothetical protein